MANRQHNGKSISRSAPRRETPAHLDDAVTGSSEDQPVQPDSTDQSGSAGRPTGGRHGTGKDTGQGRYGQSGLGGKEEAETDGQAAYRRTGDGKDDPNKSDSSEGSGSSKAVPEDERKLKSGKPKPIYRN